MFARNTYSCPFCLFDIYGVTDYDLIYLMVFPRLELCGSDLMPFSSYLLTYEGFLNLHVGREGFHIISYFKSSSVPYHLIIDIAYIP